MLKLSIKYINKFSVTFGILLIIGFFLHSSAALAISDNRIALNSTELNVFSQNDILFYEPCEGVTRSGNSSLCGKNAVEKYWSAISKYIDDPIKIAGIIGNLKHEGGMNPAAWEGGPTAEGGGIYGSTGELRLGWDYYYNCNSRTTGVGAFAITWDLCKYLQYVDKNAPDFSKYFKNTTEYSFNYQYHPGCKIGGDVEVYGDCLLKKIGDTEYEKLVEFEAEYALGPFNPSATEKYKSLNFSSPEEAAYWWEKNWEKPKAGSTQYRQASAKKAYDELKDFSCSGSSSKSSSSSSSSSSDTKSSSSSSSSSSDTKSSSSNTVSGKDITWIGDSYSTFVNDQGLMEKNFSGVDIGSISGSKPRYSYGAASYIHGSKAVAGDSRAGGASCLNILEKIIKADKLRPYLVFACGTNGGWDKNSIKKFQELLKGKDTKVIVVNSRFRACYPTNIHCGDPSFKDSNKLLKSMADSNDNIFLADWAAIYDAKYFKMDPVHPYDDPGGEKWIGVISDALKEASGNNCNEYSGEYPEYLQSDHSKPWADMSYGDCGDGTTVSACGCGACSMAMLSTVATGKEIFPQDIVNLTFSKGTYYKVNAYELDKIVADEYGLEIENVTVKDTKDAKQKIKEKLEDGYMIHMTCYGAAPCFGNGHMIGLYEIKDGETVVAADSANGVKEYKLSDFVSRIKHGYFVAIKKGSSKACEKETNDNCPTDDTSSDSGPVEGGLTEEQAQKIADYYNSNKVDASWSINGKLNCVTMSSWFTAFFTDIGSSGKMKVTRGNGHAVAQNLASDYGLENSTTPAPYSIFSSTIFHGNDHTGVVVGIEGDEIITIEAEYWSPGRGKNGTVKRDKIPKGSTTYTYLDPRMDKDKLSQVIGGSL